MQIKYLFANQSLNWKFICMSKYNYGLVSKLSKIRWAANVLTYNLCCQCNFTFLLCSRSIVIITGGKEICNCLILKFLHLREPRFWKLNMRDFIVLNPLLRRGITKYASTEYNRWSFVTLHDTIVGYRFHNDVFKWSSKCERPRNFT